MYSKQLNIPTPSSLELHLVALEVRLVLDYLDKGLVHGREILCKYCDTTYPTDLSNIKHSTTSVVLLSSTMFAPNDLHAADRFFFLPRGLQRALATCKSSLRMRGIEGLEL